MKLDELRKSFSSKQFAVVDRATPPPVNLTAVKSPNMSMQGAGRLLASLAVEHANWPAGTVCQLRTKKAPSGGGRETWAYFRINPGAQAKTSRCRVRIQRDGGARVLKVAIKRYVDPTIRIEMLGFQGRFATP